MVSKHSSTRTTVSLNKHVVTSEISTCTNTDWSNLKMLTNTMQNKVSTKVVPAVSSGIALSTPLNKVHSESKDLQHEDNISMLLHQNRFYNHLMLCNRFLRNFK